MQGSSTSSFLPSASQAHLVSHQQWLIRLSELFYTVTREEEKSHNQLNNFKKEKKNHKNKLRSYLVPKFHDTRFLLQIFLCIKDKSLRSSTIQTDGQPCNTSTANKTNQSLTCKLQILLAKFIFQLIISIGQRIVKIQANTKSSISNSQQNQKQQQKMSEQRNSTANKLCPVYSGSLCS